MRIQNNMMAMNTHRQMGVNQTAQAKSTEKLSSGFRINRAGDDAAGLSISEKMRGQIRGLNRASANAQDGISLIQAAEGALQETHSILQRVRELAVQGANDVNATEDRVAIKGEIDQLGLELDRIATSTNFNGKFILSGAYENPADLGGVGSTDGDNIPEELKALGVEFVSAGLNIQVGANALQNDVIKLNITGVTAKDLLNNSSEVMWADTDVKDGFDSATEGFQPEAYAEQGAGALGFDNAKTETASGTEVNIAGFQALVNVIDGKTANEGKTLDPTSERKTGIALVNEIRSNLGAVQNRLEHTVSNVDTIAENMQSAESRIRDVDMAKEMMSFTKNNVLNQAATAMLAQANQAPQSVLSLIR